MAEQEKGNINLSYNNATTGLNRDQTLNQIQKGKLTHALNAIVENFDSTSINYQNEPGNEWCLTFPKDFVLIGSHFINEKNKHIFFLTNPITGDNQIGFMYNNDCVYRELISSPCLGWNVNHPIQKIVHKITNCSTELYWPDNVARRYLDIDNLPYKLKESSDLCTPEYSQELDCNKLKLQPNFNIPIIKIIDVIPGGNLTSGIVQFALQYSDASGNPYTSYYSITNPTPIADVNMTSVNFNFPVGKSVILNIFNLDVSGQFQYFNLAVIKTVNNISSSELIGTYFIETRSRNITYTGQNVEQIKLSMNDIFEKFPFYELADDITTAQEVLIWKGLSSIDRVNYQSIASQINLQWETWRIPSTETYADEINATNLRGYLRDEIYSFEILFLLKNGKQTDAFHIPGRVKNSNEHLMSDVSTLNDDFIGKPDSEIGGVGYSPYWKIYNTASVIGTSEGFSTDKAYKGPYQYGEFAYWESHDEVYPCNTDLWGELAGQKIRHHKFPDVLVSPIYESPTVNTEIVVIPEYKILEFTVQAQTSLKTDLEMQNNAIFPIGVKISIAQIQDLINISNLSDSQKEDIVGFKIVRGDRGVNKSIIAKGILRNVNKYTRQSQDFYYPNYPYNDLNDDPFLNTTNNAFSQICGTFNIKVIILNHPYSLPTSMEVVYTDCTTGKEEIAVYTAIGDYTLCSLTKPIVQHAGVTNKLNVSGNDSQVIDASNVAIVGYANYDRWKLSVKKVKYLGTYRAGWRASWEDPITGSARTTWVEGSDQIIVHTMVGTKPVHIENDTSIITFIDEVRVGSCTEDEFETDSVGFDETNTHRQIFNSPETSFGQPFLGDILKLENVMFGAGKAHFVEVKDNAKYKLLSAEAQRDALLASEKLAIRTNPINPSALFTAYQAYLAIYINSITRKNYAQSFNSIANYDYSKSIPNGLEIKQRNLEIARYLIPTVQSVGDDYPINNWNRETSVYLKTEEDVTPLPVPSESPNMLLVGESIVKDKSRFTISEAGNCNKPEKEKDISVVSYYASIKNQNLNQWGQIYSYDVIDTGFQALWGQKDLNTVFGGDTFIGRFAFKTKLPFFIDNRVKAPDDSDIFYDEIGNIAYPQYWHSARSIHKDYVVDQIGTLHNIIASKAHEFDCASNQEPGPPEASAETNPNRTYYNGYFYLFAYGVPNFYCESSYNLDLRQAFNNREGDFWPHVSTSIPDDWVQESFVSILNDNTYHYNVTYSKQNKENTFTHLPADWKESFCLTNYPFRAIYSDVQNIDSDNKVNSWLTYRAIAYFDFPQNYGDFVSIDGIQNKAILTRFTNKSLLYNNLLIMDTSNPQAAYLGNALLFKGAPPIDFAETDLGYVGTQHKMLLKIPQGQISVDAKRGQVFLITGTEATDLSAFGSGLNRFFTEHLPFEILKFFPTVDIDNNFIGVGLHGVFDNKYERVIITKLDYIPLSTDIEYDGDTKEFYITRGRSREVVLLKDSNYFCNKSWTLSFNFNTKSWISFHSYIPNWYIAENNFFYSGLNNCCDDFDFAVGELIANPTTTTTTTIYVPTTTTTSTTQTLPNCTLEGTAIFTDCNFEITGVIIPPPTTTTTSTETPLTTTTTTEIV